jgi:hypothetical protein
MVKDYSKTGHKRARGPWPYQLKFSDLRNCMMYLFSLSSGNPVVADFGCGEARLARAVSTCCKKVHSFDLVAANELVSLTRSRWDRT